MFEKIDNNSFRRRVKSHLIGREHDFFAVVQPGFEKRSGAELADLGLKVKDGFIEGGVEFTGKPDSCYIASLMSRTAGRIIMRVAGFRSANYFELERTIRTFPWELYILSGSRIEFRSSASRSMIYHTGKLEEIFSFGISERLAAHGISIETEESPCVQTVFLRNTGDVCTVSLDASGKFLYKRGSGKNIGRAPLRETTAALILLEAGIGSYEQILDPMCGSGTFSLEAAAILTGTPPAAERNFPFMNWPCFREKTFRYIKDSALKSVISAEDLKLSLFTSDIDPVAVETARSNIPENFSGLIRPSVSDFFSLPADLVKDKKTLIVLNPPYGKRLDRNNEYRLYREIGLKIKKDFGRCGFAIIVPGHDKEKMLSLGYDRKIPFMNGGIKSAVIFKDA